MMRKFCLVLMVISFCSVFGQEEKIVNKVHFTYEAKTNFIEEELGFYVDSLMMKERFPKLKYVLKVSPKDATKILAYASYRDMDKEQERMFHGTLAHSDETMTGTYDVKRNITTIKHKRHRMQFRWTTTIDYNKQKVYIDYPSVSYEFDLGAVTFADAEKKTGFTREIRDGKTYSKMLYFDADLNPKVTANLGLINNEAGATTIVDAYRTITLTSVSYN